MHAKQNRCCEMFWSICMQKSSLSLMLSFDKTAIVHRYRVYFLLLAMKLYGFLFHKAITLSRAKRYFIFRFIKKWIGSVWISACYLLFGTHTKRVEPCCFFLDHLRKLLWIEISIVVDCNCIFKKINIQNWASWRCWKCAYVLSHVALFLIMIPYRFANKLTWILIKIIFKSITRNWLHRDTSL